MTRPRSRRFRAPHALSIAAVALVAAVSAPLRADAQPANDIDREDQALAYAQCLREHGVEDFPDPDGSGRTAFRIDDSSAARFRSAIEACRELAPAGLASGPPSPERTEALVDFADCMRENGVAEFPDPSVQGVFMFDEGDADIEGPAMQAAMQTCTELASDTLGGVAISMGVRR
jgi:hypothetical protein